MSLAVDSRAPARAAVERLLRNFEVVDRSRRGPSQMFTLDSLRILEVAWQADHLNALGIPY